MRRRVLVVIFDGEDNEDFLNAIPASAWQKSAVIDDRKPNFIDQCVQVARRCALMQRGMAT